MHGILAVVITLCAPAFAGADVIAYTAFWGGDVFSGTRTDTVKFDEFDPAYGTLTDVQAHLYGGGHEVVHLTGNPLDNAAMVLHGSFSALGDVRAFTSDDIITPLPATITISANGGGTVGASILDTELAAFVGTGTIGIGIDQTFYPEIALGPGGKNEPPGPSGTVVSTADYGDIMLTYTYTSATIPNRRRSSSPRSAHSRCWHCGANVLEHRPIEP
jgi:hypothetical protein